MTVRNGLRFVLVGSVFAALEVFLTVLALLAPQNIRFVLIIGLIVMGYLALNIFYARHFWTRAGKRRGMRLPYRAVGGR